MSIEDNVHFFLQLLKYRNFIPWNFQGQSLANLWNWPPPIHFPGSALALNGKKLFFDTTSKKWLLSSQREICNTVFFHKRKKFKLQCEAKLNVLNSIYHTMSCLKIAKTTKFHCVKDCKSVSLFNWTRD